MRTSTRHVLLALAALLLLTLAAPAAGLAAPGNDDRADAQPLTLPARLSDSTAGSTLEAREPGSSCADVRGTLWYRFSVPKRKSVVVNLAAAGRLDASITVYRLDRSQTTEVACDDGNTRGQASLRFRTEVGGEYLVRVGQRANSVAGTFSLEVFLPRADAVPPGPHLRAGGVTGALDTVFDPNDAYSAILRAGRTYRVNLVSRGSSCVDLSIFAPGTRSFDGAPPVAQASCGGYRLFTPGPGEGGRYSFRLQAQGRAHTTQRYHLQVARAGRDDTAPGRFVRNYARVRAAVNGGRADVVDLYRFDVVRRSDLDLRLATGAAHQFDLELLSDRGREIGCACGSAGDQSLRTRIRPGRYFAVVRARHGSHGRYLLRRISRTITSTRVRWGAFRHARTRPGHVVPIRVRVRPFGRGPVTLIVERFDPLEGYQFLRRYRVRVRAGQATVPFLPPSVGRYHVRASFEGTRTESPSDSGTSSLLVAGPLRQ